MSRADWIPEILYEEGEEGEQGEGGEFEMTICNIKIN